MKRERADVVVVGAGIAGASLAADLAVDHSVLLLEREAFPGQHSTGRSAALFSEIYGGAAIRALSRASRNFLFNPPAGFVRTAIVRPRTVLHIAAQTQLSALDAFCNLRDIAPAMTRMDTTQSRQLCPVLREDYLSGAALENGSADVDVDALHQGWLRQLKANGGRLLLNAGVTALERRSGGWTVATPSQEIDADVVVNAAGAWADQLAILGGVEPIGLQPKRRTASIVETAGNGVSEQWPMVIDIGEQFYFRPDSGGLLLSPADETPMSPCDAQPDEWDIATAIDRVQQATTLDIRRVRRSWAGLRSFVADRNPVVGYAPDAPGFFWLAGQGGYGIQTSPAMARVASALIRKLPLADDLLGAGIVAGDLRPGRLG